MAGIPQLREAAWLYGDDPDLPLALVRLFERMDGSDVWEVRLNYPAASPTQSVEHPDEQSAQAEVERLYAEGRQHGVWRVRRRGD
ncbi:hypothetical protein [Micromonospora sp. NBRC 101691]|uniref:hypothetical protein n=1 Tax=Micromonospora sp. NBRC 101691 TaxID=3032198 RepID=UPI002556FA84|nr:hypothetical protein [Micromonospora sp. NBRC 101691]